MLVCCSPGVGEDDMAAGRDEHGIVAGRDESPLNIALAAPTDDEFMDDEPARDYPQDAEDYVWYPDVRQRRCRGSVLDGRRYRIPSAHEVPSEMLCRCDFGHAAALSARDPYFVRWFEATHYKEVIGACTCECYFCKP